MIDFLKRSFDRLPIPEEKRDIFNLPNTITMLRIGVIPVLFGLLFSPGPAMSLVITILFIAAALTDLLDGYIARRYEIVTTMGKFLDPIADKLIVNTAMILMIPIGRIPAWIVAIIIIRDFAVDGIRNIASSEGMIIQASPLGKRKTLCQIFAVSALMIHYPFIGADAHAVGMVILYIALILTVTSGIDYFIRASSSVASCCRRRACATPAASRTPVPRPARASATSLSSRRSSRMRFAGSDARAAASPRQSLCQRSRPPRRRRPGASRSAPCAGPRRGRARRAWRGAAQSHWRGGRSGACRRTPCWSRPLGRRAKARVPSPRGSRQPPATPVMVGQALDVVLQREQAGRRQDPRLPHAAAPGACATRRALDDERPRCRPAPSRPAPRAPSTGTDSPSRTAA